MITPLLPPQAKRWLARRILLPRKLQAARSFVNLASAWSGGLADKRVLEVGSDQLGRNLLAASELGAMEAVGVNPIMIPEELRSNVRIMSLDATDLPFDDGYFDVAITDSTFEHVHDLSGVLSEVHRVVKPAGRLYAHFGPIWSSPYGHHLWVRVNGREYTYWDVVLPSWCHILDHEESTREFCVERLSLPSLVADAIVDWVYRSDEQNRVLFDDYYALAKESPWNLLWFKGYDHSDLAPLYRSQESVAIRHKLLAERWPGRTGWLYDGAAMVLERGRI